MFLKKKKKIRRCWCGKRSMDKFVFFEFKNRREKKQIRRDVYIAYSTHTLMMLFTLFLIDPSHV